MVLTAELSLVLLGLLALGVWGLTSGLRTTRAARRAPLQPVQLTALSQPFRDHMGRMLEVWRTLDAERRRAPPPLRGELTDVTDRVAGLVARALPRAQRGTRLLDYLRTLPPSDPERAATEAARARVEAELEGFLATLRALQGKVIRALTEAGSLGADAALRAELQDVLFDVEALEEAFLGIAGEAP